MSQILLSFSFLREQMPPQKSKHHLLCIAYIPSVLSVYTHPVTGKLKTVSVGSKSGRLRRSLAISITTLAVASERFFAERIAKTLVRISHSGCPGFCLARKGKYLQEKNIEIVITFFNMFISKNMFQMNFYTEFNKYICICVWTLIRLLRREITLKSKIWWIIILGTLQTAIELISDRAEIWNSLTPKTKPFLKEMYWRQAVFHV